MLYNIHQVLFYLIWQENCKQSTVFLYIKLILVIYLSNRMPNEIETVDVVVSHNKAISSVEKVKTL